MSARRDPPAGARDRHPGRPGACVATGTAMLALPSLLAVTTLGSQGPETGLLISVLLAVGALAVAFVSVRPDGAVMPALAVLCAGLALAAEPPMPIGAALCGVACLAFLLAVRLHRQARRGRVDTAGWLAAHRPMAVGAAVTTPPAVAAALVPTGSSLLVAALAGLVIAVLCTALLLHRTR